MAEPLLEARELVKSYRLPHKTVTVLTGASLTVAAGERVAVIGPSGAGKTTLLQVLATRLRPAQGQLELLGQRPWALSARARQRLRARIGLIHQAPPLPPRQRFESCFLVSHAGRVCAKGVTCRGIQRLTRKPGQSLNFAGGRRDCVGSGGVEGGEFGGAQWKVAVGVTDRLGDQHVGVGEDRREQVDVLGGELVDRGNAEGLHRAGGVEQDAQRFRLAVAHHGDERQGLVPTPVVGPVEVPVVLPTSRIECVHGPNVTA